MYYVLEIEQRLFKPPTDNHQDIVFINVLIKYMTLLSYVTTSIQWKFYKEAILGTVKKWPLQRMVVIENVLFKSHVLS